MDFRDLDDLSKNRDEKESTSIFGSLIKELSERFNNKDESKESLESNLNIQNTTSINTTTNTNQSIIDFKAKIEAIKNKTKELNNSQVLEEGKIYAIQGISNEKLQVVDIKDGYNFDVYISINEETLKELNDKGITNKIYEMSKENFYTLEQGDNIAIENGKCVPYEGEIKITNDKAREILDELYFNLKNEEGRNYIFTDIKDEKIYMQDTEYSVEYQVYKEVYPDWKIGDVITRQNGKYIKKQN